MLRETGAEPKPPAPSPPLSGMGESMKAWGIALDLVFMTVGGFGVGWLIDRWLHSDPAGVLIGLALGFVTGFVRLVRSSLRAEARDQARKRK
ncbi:MAG: AtpZ/AtpI family protein [Phycisphaerales bacterium]|nr:AtpZ/AtpI family protein [Phycisphaerales bacterium]